jgi:dTMP kinase
METAGARGGFFISFEGPEGGGKSTQIDRLASALAERGYNVWTTREPGGTRAGEMVRAILLGPKVSRLSPWAEALLFTAARAQLVEEVIRPRLERGEVVMTDRYADSTLAYQGFGRGLDLDRLRQLQRDATGGLEPNLTVLLNLPIETGLARIPPREQDRLDRETTSFHHRVHDGYRQLAAAAPERWREVDASADPAQVGATILEYVTETLRRAGVRPAQRRSA